MALYVGLEQETEQLESHSCIASMIISQKHSMGLSFSSFVLFSKAGSQSWVQTVHSCLYFFPVNLSLMILEVHKLCSLRAKPLTSLSMQPIPVDKMYPHSWWKKEMRGLLQMLITHSVWCHQRFAVCFQVMFKTGLGHPSQLSLMHFEPKISS